jgi:ABC-type branched-subunit amino acid transport system ATPase component
MEAIAPMSLLEARAVEKRYGGVVALAGCSVVIERPGIYGLIGPNGAGKTTLFDVITGATLPDAGSVGIEGRDITGLAPYRLKSIGVSRTFQECRVFPQFTCLENLLFALQLHGGGKAKEAHRMLELVNLHGSAHEPASSLSFGQRRLLEIVGTFIVQPKFLLLDEPASGVNPVLLETLADFLRTMYRERPGVFLIVEHNMQFIMQLANELIVMHQGVVLDRGAPAAIQASPRVIEAYLG